MVTKNRMMGKRYDGGLSPLGKPVDFSRMLPPEGLASALKYGRDDELVQFPGGRNLRVKLSDLREFLSGMGVTTESVVSLDPREQNRLTLRVQKLIEKSAPAIVERAPDGDLTRSLRERGDIHRSLRPWARGPLALEKPQGSSYHLLSEFDARLPRPGSNLKYVHEIDEQFGPPQCVVVENDWARSLGEKDNGGEVRVPWPRSCWEFRISGVRVLAMVTTDLHRTTMFCVYGKDRGWVSDDFSYDLHASGRMTGSVIHAKLGSDVVEFRRVAELVHRQIRACLIMLDVGVVRHENERASAKMIERRRAEGRPPPRDHLVVRLAPRSATRSHSGPRIAGPAVPRSRQRGHLRRGCWVHYDDQGSGEEQYVNDGGFVVSRTWRKWHWAGDLDNMIEREYRL